jgi:hypothetical protein
MTLGRPMMTSCHFTVPLPSHIDDDASVQVQDQLESSRTLSFLAFYVETIKLYQILGNVLTKVYKPWSGNTPSSNRDTKDIQHKDLEAIVSLDEDLSNFEENIIPSLHWERGAHIRESLPESDVMVLRRQMNVLQVR